MDVCSIIKTRLQGLGFDQKDLVAAAEVAESHVSQLPIRKKLPSTVKLSGLGQPSPHEPIHQSL